MPEGTTHALALYHNDGTGHFQDVTAGSGLDVSVYGMGVAVGDYDNDGLVDVFITAVGSNHLFRNLGQGKFADVTAAAGVGGATNQWSTSCAWIDYDNDGDLDLFVCNYVQWSREIDLEVNYQLPGHWPRLRTAHEFRRHVSLPVSQRWRAAVSRTSPAPAGSRSKSPAPTCPWPSPWVSRRSTWTGTVGSI